MPSDDAIADELAYANYLGLLAREARDQDRAILADELTDLAYTCDRYYDGDGFPMADWVATIAAAYHALKGVRP